jgi:hypothetical protein
MQPEGLLTHEAGDSNRPYPSPTKGQPVWPSLPEHASGHRLGCGDARRAGHLSRWRASSPSDGAPSLPLTGRRAVRVAASELHASARAQASARMQNP